jgi:hypothetical protein
LFVRPPDPLIARTQPARGGAENQHAEPTAAGVDDDIVQSFADGFERAEVMVLCEELVAAHPFAWLHEPDANAFQALLLSGGGQHRLCFLAPSLNCSIAPVQP